MICTQRLFLTWTPNTFIYLPTCIAAPRTRSWTNDGLVNGSSTEGVGGSTTTNTTTTPCDENNTTTTNTTDTDGMIKPKRSSPESRILDDMEDTTVFEKSNVLLVGPTGSGM